jgi:hypothetical protein
LNAKDQVEAALWKMNMLQIRVHQLKAPAQMSLGRMMEAFTLLHWNVQVVRPRFQNIQGNTGKIHDRDMLPSRGKK